MLKPITASLALALLAASAGAADPRNGGGAPPAAPQGPVALDFAEWSFFSWGSGEPAPANPTFTYSSPIATTVTVVDAFCSGDRFEVFVDAVSVGLTSVPASSSCDLPNETEDPDVALGLDDYSSGTFAVPAGTHTVDISAVTNPFDGGGAFIRLGAPNNWINVPTLSPIGLALLVALLATAGALLLVRRRRTA